MRALALTGYNRPQYFQQTEDLTMAEYTDCRLSYGSVQGSTSLDFLRVIYAPISRTIIRVGRYATQCVFGQVFSTILIVHV
jgi:hypothetical protein